MYEGVLQRVGGCCVDAVGMVRIMCRIYAAKPLPLPPKGV